MKNAPGWRWWVWWSGLGFCCLLWPGYARSDGPMQEPGQWAILAFLSDAPDLADARRHCLENLEISSRSPNILCLAESGTQRWRIERGRRRCALTYAGAGKGSADALATFVKWGADEAQGRQMALVLLGHGTPVAVLGGAFGDDACDPGLRLIEGARPLSAEALGDAIREGLGARGRLDVAFLDCCYGAGIETAAALTRATRVLVGSPSQLQAPGLPWEAAFMPERPSAARRTGETVAAACIRRLAAERASLPSPVAAVREDAVGELLQTLDRLAAELSTWDGEYLPIVTLARANSARWGVNREICDVMEFASALADSAPDDRSRSAARRLQEAAQGTVLNPARGAGEGGPRTGSALGVYFPPPLQRLPGAYSRAAAKNGYETWARFVEHYLAVMSPDGALSG